MKNILIIIVASVFIFSCTEKSKDVAGFEVNPELFSTPEIDVR